MHEPFRFPPLNVITPFHPESCGTHIRNINAQQMNITVSGAPGANKVMYCPFRLYERSTAQVLSYRVGATQNGNVDAGIYNEQKELLVSSGSTAQGAINELQELDITDTVLEPGLYFMAITLSSATGTVFRMVQIEEFVLNNLPVYIETTGAFGLPNPAAFALDTATASPFIVVMGVHFDALV